MRPVRVAVALLAMVAAGCSAEPPPVAAPPPDPKPVELAWSRATHLVRRWDRWATASSADREGAARALARRVRESNVFGREDFAFSGLETHGTVQVAVFDDPVSGLAFVLAPGGERELGVEGAGAGEPSLRPRRTVEVGPLLVARTEVTQEVWRSRGGERRAHFVGPRRPMEDVTFAEAAEWCDELDLRLPTVDEWEAFARAEEPVWEAGDEEGLRQLRTERAWGFTDACGRPQDVATKSPNALGLHDVLGNVAEYVRELDAEGAAVAGMTCAMGGSWQTADEDLHPSLYHRDAVLTRGPAVGFRPVFDLPR